ncbi:MAG TPA: ATP-binding protein, partial [Bacteroidetes bacterium]|nr:ATP-binding protein [Bacteroidota bacterium]
MFSKKVDKSVKVEGDNLAPIITGDNNTLNLPRHKIPKVLPKQVGLANDIDFVGRKEELQNVDELLNQNSMLLLLNGIGGIGKSTLVSYYLNQHKEAYNYYGFIQVDNDIKLNLVTALSTSLNLQSEKIDDL